MQMSEYRVTSFLNPANIVIVGRNNDAGLLVVEIKLTVGNLVPINIIDAQLVGSWVIQDNFRVGYKLCMLNAILS